MNMTQIFSTVDQFALDLDDLDYTGICTAERVAHKICMRLKLRGLKQVLNRAGEFAYGETEDHVNIHTTCYKSVMDAIEAFKQKEYDSSYTIIWRIGPQFLFEMHNLKHSK